ncbi:VanZ family protein [Siminovitchia fortis]|uniref:VanZ family protein n=1 Tax=Siminovitchia fortis TaxID=254758 RepID=A0A443IZ99_9BACI|nr:VanZ family protein [Siminovitchia fortis]RWR13598.1 VanZ family protein [Siminovitchia fortis]WHY81945.1 VanZ family protein [Siminovitchia fortis]
MRKRHIWLIAAIAWAAAIFIATHLPSSTGGNTQVLIEKLFGLSSGQAALVNVAFRKLVHLGAFGLLAVLLFNSFEKSRFLLAWVITTVYAATDEIHQSFVPDRTASVWDVVLDSLGALIALGMIKLLNQRSYKKS